MTNLGPDTVFHLVMRYADNFLGIESTITEHMRIVREHGAVWMTKVGKPLADQKILRLNGQIRDGTPTHVFLVTSTKQGIYKWTLGAISQLSRAAPTDEHELIPEYYAKRATTDGRLWLRLTKLSPLPSLKVKQIYVASSDQPISTTLKRSMAGLFLVYIQKTVPNSHPKAKFKDDVLGTLDEWIASDWSRSYGL